MSDLWTCEWGYKAFFGCCSSQKAGVCILFNNNFNLQIHKHFLDPKDCFIICDIVADGKSHTLANQFMLLMKTTLVFFQSFFFLQFSSFKCEEIIICGDFNLVLDVEIDKKGGLARTHIISISDSQLF